MRQRLLLFAGWVIAAVGSGLVASGAVAVAGGQVSDRPLRPLTAAEVAALPVVGSVGFSEPSEPLASGGFVSTTGEPTGGVGDAAPGPDDEPDPAGDRGAAIDLAGPIGPVSVDDSATDEPAASPSTISPVIDEPALTAQVVHLSGGSAAFAGSDQGLIFLWATPKPGFVASLDRRDTDRVTASFRSELHLSIIDARWIEGELVIDTAETRDQ